MYHRPIIEECLEPNQEDLIIWCGTTFDKYFSIETTEYSFGVLGSLTDDQRDSFAPEFGYDKFSVKAQAQLNRRNVINTLINLSEEVDKVVFTVYKKIGNAYKLGKPILIKEYSSSYMLPTDDRPKDINDYYPLFIELSHTETTLLTDSEYTYTLTGITDNIKQNVHNNDPNYPTVDLTLPEYTTQKILLRFGNITAVQLGEV